MANRKKPDQTRRVPASARAQTAEPEFVNQFDGKAATGANTAYGNSAGNQGFRMGDPGEEWHH